MDNRLWDRADVDHRWRDYLDYDDASGSLGDLWDLPGSLGIVGGKWRGGRSEYGNRAVGATITGGCTSPGWKHQRVICELDTGWNSDRIRIWADNPDCQQRWKRVPSIGKASGHRTCAAVFAGWPANPLLPFSTEGGFQLDLGKWTPMEKMLTRFLRTGKNRPTSAAETGRGKAITIISKQDAGTLRPSG